MKEEFNVQYDEGEACVQPYGGRHPSNKISILRYYHLRLHNVQPNC